MLCKLSLTNIKKSFKDYAIYFVTLVLGVCIFYIFNSMDSQTAMLAVNNRQSQMIEILIKILSYVSIFVSFILGFLIIYASRFLIKKRNKEFGVYMTLGMSKRKISLLLLIETFIIGLISLVAGLLLGVVLSQVTSIFVANMFEADMTKFAFNFSKAATIKTIIYFATIYFIVMIFNTIIINKNKLINLLQASKRGENIKIKNPYLCTILFIIAIIMLGRAYYMVTLGIEDLVSHDISILILPISLGIAGTIILFYSAAGMILKIVSKCHNYYHKNLNTFVFKQISSKINTMVISISVICIMLFLTLCLLSSSLTIKNYFNSSVNKYAPVDFNLYDEADEHGETGIRKFLNDPIIKENTKDTLIVTNYVDENFKYSDSLGNYKEEAQKKYPNIGYNIYIVSETNYNQLAKLYNLEKANLNSDEYTIVVNYNKEIYQEVVNHKSILNIFGIDLKPSKKGIIDGFQLIGGNPSNPGFFVVKDDILDGQNKHHELLVANYNTKDEKIISSIENKLSKYRGKTYVMYDTKAEIKDASAGLTTIITFIGLYIGIIFLISSSAILALKELSDCLDDRNKYKILRQIGAEEKDINKALFKQTFIFFMIPLSLSIVHTFFGLKFCKWILSSMGIDNMLDGVLMTFIFLVAIYGIYFMVTYLCNKNIIREKI